MSDIPEDLREKARAIEWASEQAEGCEDFTGCPGSCDEMRVPCRMAVERIAQALYDERKRCARVIAEGEGWDELEVLGVLNAY